MATGFSIFTTPQSFFLFAKNFLTEQLPFLDRKFVATFQLSLTLTLWYFFCVQEVLDYLLINNNLLSLSNMLICFYSLYQFSLKATLFGETSWRPVLCLCPDNRSFMRNISLKKIKQNKTKIN